MSVIQRIRDKAAWFVFGAIALSLIAFILQDAFTRRGGYFSSSTTLAKINGVTIDRDLYEHKLDFYEQANGTPRAQLMGSVWDYMVEQTLMQQQYDELGLKVNSDELSDVLFGDNPPQWMQQAFTDPKTGVYNPETARQQFAQIKKNADDPRNAQLYEGYLEPTILQTLREKYQSMLTGAVYVPKWMAEKTNADNNSLAKISYVSVPYATISDSTIKVSDDEIAAYIKKHPKQYQQKDETRQIAYVSFDAAPSKADTVEVINQLNQLKGEFASTRDEKSFLARNNSELTYYDSYLNKKEIKQAINDSLFSLSVGSIYGPYADNNNYVLAKLVAERQIPDSVKVRHILVATAQQTQSGQFSRVRDDSTAKKRLDSAIALIKSGSNFDSVCAVYSDDPGSKDKGGVYDYFASGRMMEEFNDFSFNNPVGAKDIVKTAYGYHYIEVLGQKGSETGYKFAYLAKPVVASQETINAASTAATQFAATSRTKDQFDANAKKLNKSTQFATDIKPNDFTIQGIGDNRQMVKWIAENDPGDVSEPFEVSDKYVVAVILGINKPGLQSVTIAKPMVEPIIRNEKKAQQIINTKFKGTTLEQLAQSTGSSIKIADSISYQSFVINGVGNEPKILGAAFNKQLQGKASTPIAGMSAVFVVKGESVYAAPSLGLNAEMLRAQLQNQMKQQMGYRSMTAVKDAADIEDYRSKFY
ncbi:peptidylprolyl isomerase [Panacibacter ginsenosidivorans]|uniref:Periplasmic chaperone PpiD n=1 Tax=Panacibacter ginsenosidivorans TaxID=1813871 RepID=A0A5B8V9F4_9BACT|nr:SurA N-terminal domain-containing protein [Panacibacter ginsenosidivorans]QEC68107.1 peptidylprolyl isomerase [Panacibacter ginsenosidivorans]